MGHCRGPDQEQKYYVCVENWNGRPGESARTSPPGSEAKPGPGQFVEEDAEDTAASDDSEGEAGYEVLEESVVKYDTGVDMYD